MKDETLRLALIQWLESNDRNGIYADDDCIDEGLKPLTLTTALECVIELMGV